MDVMPARGCGWLAPRFSPAELAMANEPFEGTYSNTNGLVMGKYRTVRKMTPIDFNQ
jgi:hypothetical protein